MCFNDFLFTRIDLIAKLTKAPNIFQTIEAISAKVENVLITSSEPEEKKKVNCPKGLVL